MYKIPFMGYSTEWSPFEPYKLAISSSQYFGLTGNGKQHIFYLNEKLNVKLVRTFNTQQGCFDCTWSENNQNLIVSSCGNGKLFLWDLSSNRNSPLKIFHGHSKEVYSVNWNLVEKTNFISGSWDLSIKLWDPLSTLPIETFQGHDGVIYEVCWSPHNPNEFSSVAEDFHLNVWDKNQLNPVMRIKVEENEILCCDYSKYRDNLIGTGATNGNLKVWDLRKPAKPYFKVNAHEYALRKIRFNPHVQDQILTTSYDMKTVLWNMSHKQPIVKTFNHHREFVLGCSFNLFIPNLVATTSWDQTVCIFNLQ